MLKVNAKVTANMAGVPAKVSRIAKNRSLQQYLASQAAMGMDKFVPYRSGALAASVSVGADGTYITYNTPYARRMYYGDSFKFSHDQHPAAQAHWDDAYKASGGTEQLGEDGTKFLETL